MTTDLITISVSKEEVAKFREKVEGDKCAVFNVKNAIDQSIIDVIRHRETGDTELENMYPALFDVIRTEVFDIYANIYAAYEKEVTGKINQILDSESKIPVQEEKDRPEQDPEEKSQGMLHINFLVPPEEMSNPAAIKNIPINKEYENDDPATAIKKAFRAVHQDMETSMNSEAMDTIKTRFNADNVKEVIDLKAISVVDAVNIMDFVIGEDQDVEKYDPMYIFEVLNKIYALPEDLRGILQQINSMKRNANQPVMNGDGKVYWRDKKFNREEPYGESDIKKVIEETLINEEEFNETILDSAETRDEIISKTITYLQTSDKFKESFALEMIEIPVFKELCAEIALEITTCVPNEANRQFIAFNMVNLFFPTILQGDDVNKVKSCDCDCDDHECKCTGDHKCGDDCSCKDNVVQFPEK